MWVFIPLDVARNFYYWRTISMSVKVITKQEELAGHLIDKYRESVKKRYIYNDLNDRFELSSQVNREVIDALRTYFLESLYPAIPERKKMDEAFDGLNAFISHPAKTWKLLGNMTMAIFKFGHHFPLALRAGVISLESYISAKRFEKDLMKAAIKLEFAIPLTDEQFESCIAQIPRKDVETFTKDVVSLFRSLTNTTLLKKTIAILTDVINKMEANPKLFTEEDIVGIQLGVQILKKGYDLFEKYPESLRKEIINIVAENEKWYQDYVFNSVKG